MSSIDRPSKKPTRRKFIKAAATTTAAGAAVSVLPKTSFGYHNSENNTLRVGLVGCGGRGTQAVINALRADEQTEVTAFADAFEDRITLTAKGLAKNKVAKDRLNVPKENWFTGFDCFKNLINSNVDVVILATPPYFRPMQMRAAVEAGKHVFCEKPVAVDAPGVRSVLESCKLAEEKGLSVVSGLCWRYDIGVNAVIDKIKDGAIGDIVAMQENYLAGTLWHRGANEEWSEMENQLRNWVYYTWLSGDHIAEQHIHSLDKALWLMGDEPPVKAYGTGGRIARTNPKWGNVYDHFATVFEWANGVKCFAHCRQMAGCFNDVNDYIIGTKGRARILGKKDIVDHSNNLLWKYTQPKGEKKKNMYDVEHEHLFRSIREGKPINNGKYMCYSTLMAVMGREAAYTGQVIEWDKLLASEEKLGPEKMEWGDFKPKKVAIPGNGEW